MHPNGYVHLPDLSDLTESALESAAVEPASYTVDGEIVTAFPLQDQIALDKYANGKTALDGVNPNGGPKSGWGRLRTARAIPPSAGPQ